MPGRSRSRRPARRPLALAVATGLALAMTAAAPAAAAGTTPCTDAGSVGGSPVPGPSAGSAAVEARTQPGELATARRPATAGPARPGARRAIRAKVAPERTDEPPAAVEYELTCSGGWSWFGDPRAVHRDGRTFVGWIDFLGQLKVASYDHASRVRTTAVLQTRFQLDDHDNPSILVLDDGRLLVFWSAHGGSQMFYRRSLRPGDVTAWEPARTIPNNLPGTFGFTYPNPVQLAAEGGRIYLFWRGGNFNPAFATSDDRGDTWTNARHLITIDGQRPYVKVDSDGQGTIHFAFTQAHPRNLLTDIYYMAYRDGSFFRADGTRIGGLADLPLRPEQADKVYDAAAAGGVRAWTHDVGFDPGTGDPVLTFATFPSDTDHRYHWARWDGQRWLDVELTTAGGAITPDPTEQQYSGGITLDHEQPSIAYLSRPSVAGGPHEIERWQTSDGGTSWTSTAITSGSTQNNFRPVSPRGLPPGQDMEVIWMEGEYPKFTEFRTALRYTGAPTDNLAPHAVFVPTVGPQARGVTLDAGASGDPEGAPVALSWDLGDGTGATGTTVEHVYAQPGTYTVRLTAADDRGLADVYVREVSVADTVPTALRISADPRAVEPGQDVTIGGRLVRADNPNAFVAGETLQLLRRPAGGTDADWELVLQQRTPSDGLVRYLDAPAHSTEYLWRALGSVRFGPSNSPVVLVEVLVTRARPGGPPAV